MNPEMVISVRNFRKTYDSLVAVDDLNFDVKRGEIFGLLGPNGAGKTSTLESLEGLRKPDGGSLNILGVDPARQSERLRNLIGVQLQSSGLPAMMTVEEAMQFFCAYHGVSPRFDLIERLGLIDKRRDQFNLLSAGQQRRLALALAIAHRPQVIFLDEPTAGLDVPSRIELHTLMAEIRSDGTTIVLATHDMAEAEKMADRVAILLRGRIAAEGTPAQLTAAGGGLTKISVLSEANRLHADGIAFPAVAQWLVKDEYAVFFSSNPGQTVSAILAYLEANTDPLVDLRVERPSLEERFLEITQAQR
ncbi:MAG TPA: ABC transporter ATP-binding protein [Longilinea sp.]|nr:ABC transporter ATP-binding protein [Longilinea sp.]